MNLYVLFAQPRPAFKQIMRPPFFRVRHCQGRCSAKRARRYIQAPFRNGGTDMSISARSCKMRIRRQSSLAAADHSWLQPCPCSCAAASLLFTRVEAFELSGLQSLTVIAGESVCQLRPLVEGWCLGQEGMRSRMRRGIRSRCGATRSRYTASWLGDTVKPYTWPGEAVVSVV
jgi:hypothetical protein